MIGSRYCEWKRGETWSCFGDLKTMRAALFWFFYLILWDSTKKRGLQLISDLISHLSFNREGRWGTTDNFATSFLHFPLFSIALIALWGLPNSMPVHSLMLSSHLCLCLPCLLLPPFTVPCMMVLARPDERGTWPYHCSLCLFMMMVRRSFCGLIACWILAWIYSLVTWSLYERCSILR